MFEYIVTIFKVVVGVITNERLVIASLIALGLLLLWIVFSLCFSFEMRFLSGARKINNGIVKYIDKYDINTNGEYYLTLCKQGDGGAGYCFIHNGKFSLCSSILIFSSTNFLNVSELAIFSASCKLRFILLYKSFSVSLKFSVI